MTPDEIAARFGWVVGLIRWQPELRALFDEAVSSGEWDETASTWVTMPMSSEEFAARLRATSWYQRRTEEAR